MATKTRLKSHELDLNAVLNTLIEELDEGVPVLDYDRLLLFSRIVMKSFQQSIGDEATWTPPPENGLFISTKGPYPYSQTQEWEDFKRIEKTYINEENIPAFQSWQQHQYRWRVLDKLIYPDGSAVESYIQTDTGVSTINIFFINSRFLDLTQSYGGHSLKTSFIAFKSFLDAIKDEDKVSKPQLVILDLIAKIWTSINLSHKIGHLNNDEKI